jgi:serine/threonine-protein kinase
MFPPVLPQALEGFEVLARLGRGGAGNVYLAKSRAGTQVAIKVLNDDMRYDVEVREALTREARLTSRLNHDAIVQLRAYIDRPEVAALVMEYVPGVALERLLRFAEKRGQRLPELAAWHVLDRILAALAFAHAHTDDDGNLSPIVHRDVSPSNVLLDWSGVVKLTDFGLGKVLGVASTTRLGLVKGTPGCMAPEQARGEPVTERADVYAAALIGWRLATGRAPFAKFKDDDVEMLRAMRHPKIDALAIMRPDLPPALHAAFVAALEINPELRTITAAELEEAVRGSFDVDRGEAELKKLLGKWRDNLERDQPGVQSDPLPRSSGERKDSGPTQRYEEVAEAMDDGAPRAKLPSLADLGELELGDDVKTGAYVRAPPAQPKVPSLPPVRVDTAPSFLPVGELPAAPVVASEPIVVPGPASSKVKLEALSPPSGETPIAGSEPPLVPRGPPDPDATQYVSPFAVHEPKKSTLELWRAAAARPEVLVLGIAIAVAFVALVAAVVWVAC